MDYTQFSTSDIFNTFGEFVDFAETTDPGDKWTEDSSSEEEGVSSKRVTTPWYGLGTYLDANGGATYQEALELSRYGYPDGLNKLRNVELENAARSYVDGNMWHSDVIGMRPIVPNVLAGVPDSMLNMRLAETLKPVIKIFAYACAHCGMKAIEYATHGAAMASLIDSIESQGVSVELNIIFAVVGSYGSGETHYCQINIKESSQPLDRNALAMAFIHPAFFRRFIFRWIENDIRFEDCRSGYGSPLRKEAIDKLKHDQDTLVLHPLDDDNKRDSFDEKLTTFKARYEDFNNKAQVTV